MLIGIDWKNCLSNHPQELHFCNATFGGIVSQWEVSLVQPGMCLDSLTTMKVSDAGMGPKRSPTKSPSVCFQNDWTTLSWITIVFLSTKVWISNAINKMWAYSAELKETKNSSFVCLHSPFLFWSSIGLSNWKGGMRWENNRNNITINFEKVHQLL